MPGLLLDIEGTTTPISFVYDVLFPFARAHVEQHLGAEDLGALRLEHDTDAAKGLHPPPWGAGAAKYVYWLMDHDRKSTALKNLQGKIWQQGYAQGVLRGEVFPDVPPALERWHAAGIDVRIYSSGSVLAQKLLFSTTRAGDLTKFLKGHFDTATGVKTDPASYVSIAAAFGLPVADILFISDVTRELEAASRSGMRAVLCVRPGNAVQPPHNFPAIFNFNEVLP